MKYIFDVEKEFKNIESQWKNWSGNTGLSKFVIGISGGIDSTCVAALACRIFGKDSVIGVSLPCNGQKDIADVDKVFEHLGIRRITIDIGRAFDHIVESISSTGVVPSSDTTTNLPARLRMSTLYAVSQSIPNSVPVNTCNISETVNGYDTIFGDSCGGFAPIKEYTKTEVRSIARYLGVPEDLVTKTPIDGLQSASDEERFGYTYSEIDDFIRNGNAKENVKNMILKRYNSNRFKMEICNVPGVKTDLPNHVTKWNI